MRDGHQIQFHDNNSSFSIQTEPARLSVPRFDREGTLIDVQRSIWPRHSLHTLHSIPGRENQGDFASDTASDAAFFNGKRECVVRDTYAGVSSRSFSSSTACPGLSDAITAELTAMDRTPTFSS
jgi:hypothetical protein